MKYSILSALALLVVVSRDIVAAARGLRASPASDGDEFVNRGHGDFVPYFFPHYQIWRDQDKRDTHPWDRPSKPVPYYPPQDAPGGEQWDNPENWQDNWDGPPRRDSSYDNGNSRSDGGDFKRQPDFDYWNHHPENYEWDRHYPPRLQSAPSTSTTNPVNEDKNFGQSSYLQDNFDPADDESVFLF